MSRPASQRLGIYAMCVVLLAAAVVVAVDVLRSEPSLTLLANWTGADRRDFEQHVIEPFERTYGIHVDYQGSSAESEVLQADTQAGSPPDVAVVPGPGELADYERRGRLTSLDDLLSTGDFAGAWSQHAAGEKDSHTYWVPVKVDVKSVVWHQPATSPATAARTPSQWCLGMASDATSGWPGTDWVEDILLQQAGPAAYQQWATSRMSWHDPRVERAFTTWGTLVGAGRQDLARRALQTPYGKASASVAGPHATCSLEHQSAFIRNSPQWKAAGASFVHSSALIPGARRGTDAWEVSGDLAAVFRSTPQSRQFIRYLASPAAQQDWDTGASGFSADRRVPGRVYDGDPTTRDLAATLRDPDATRCWDASDAMPATVRDAFELAVLTYLAEPKELDAQLSTLENARLRAREDKEAWLAGVCGR